MGTFRGDVFELRQQLSSAQEAHSEQLVHMLRRNEMEEVRNEFYEWIVEARKTHDVMTNNVSAWLGEAQTVSSANASKLERHECWIQHLSAWMEQLRVREQGVT